MSNTSNNIRHLVSEQKYFLVNGDELYGKFSQTTDEKISKIDSYEKLMQLKRSVDSLIEILYSNASFYDIETEFDTTKHTQAKLESQKRLQDRKRKIIESIIAHIAMQQQGVDDNRHSNNLDRIEKENIEDTDEIKNKLKLQVKEVLFAVLANRKDPKKRAGETESSNAKHAKQHGMEDKDHKRQSNNIFSSLLKLLLNVLLGINIDLSLDTPFTAKIKAENRDGKGMSI